MSNKGKKKVIEFLEVLQLRNKRSSDERVEKFLEEAFELVENREYGIALENILENLYEYSISINEELLELAKEAIQIMKMNWKDWECINELVE